MAKIKSKLYKLLKSATKEADVAHFYKTVMTFIVDGEMAYVTSKESIGADGVLEAGDFIMLLEFKYDKDFAKRKNIIEVIVQILYYLKRFEEYGEDLPDVCFVGDVNECFCFHTNDIVEYLSEDTDWSIAPSAAGKKNKELYNLLYKDRKVNPHVWEVDEFFSIEDVLKYAVDLSKNILQKKRITKRNINRLFDYFVRRVLRGKKMTGKDANELVNIFMTAVLNKEQNYIHPHRPNTLMTESFGKVIVNGQIFKSFFKHYQHDYSPKERDRLSAICDRLIEDTTRRYQGEFFTPTEWVDEAHRMIEKEFGKDWKEKYVVWEPAWGTGNLTRDYKFGELYASTLNQSDLEIAEQFCYNDEAVRFQYDFLNDDVNIDLFAEPTKMPSGLREALKSGKSIIFVYNSPYGTATSAKTDATEKRKAGIAKNAMNLRMIDDGMSRASDQLYAQFLYRTLLFVKEYKLKDAGIATFTKPLFLSGMYFKKFRRKFLKHFKYVDGMLFNAGHFDSVSSAWGVSFSMWTVGESDDKKAFSHRLKDAHEHRIVEIGTKDIYNVDEEVSLSDWVRTEIRGVPTKDEPKLKSALNVTEARGKGRNIPGSIGFLHLNSNQVQYNVKFVGLYSSSFSAENAGLPVIPANFSKAVAAFVARKTVKGNWINDKDEYTAPTIEYRDYNRWNDDGVVYSLFNNSSSQSSLRDINYKEESWNITNQWFWMSSKDIEDLAEKHNNGEIWRDCKAFPKERFVYKKLQEINLSEDAREILTAAIKLTANSFKYRKELAEKHPEYHLDSWDAGWYQIKLILKRYMPDELKEFNKKYKEFENRMREGVYKFGFLRDSDSLTTEEVDDSPIKMVETAASASESNFG